MAIYYREITVDTIAPSSPALGEIWIKPIGAPDTYQSYIWLNAWKPFTSGGVYVAEPDRDDHFINVIIQDAQPTGIIKPGWIWIKESFLQAYLYIFDYIFLAGA